MSLFEQVGLNTTAILQFILFVFALIFLSLYVFKPYLAALQEREKQTTGAQDLALDIQKDTQTIQAQYEEKARSIGREVKLIFDDYRDQATKESSQLVVGARQESQKIIDETRVKVSSEVAKANQAMSTEVPNIAQAIVQKLLAANGKL